MSRHRWRRLVSIIFVLTLMTATGLCGERVLSIGYFPNITHAHALVAQNMSAEGEGWYERYLPGVKLQWRPFNAGPSAMESLFAKAVDMTYVGPSPVLNAFIRSRGGVMVVSGAVRGGAGLVVIKNSELSKPKDFMGKRIATPQLGNTQDVACRHWLKEAGLKVTLSGGDVIVTPTPNSNMLPLFLTGQVDAAWTVEPWLSRLEMEAGAELVYSEPAETSLTTVLAASRDYAAKEPGTMEAFIRAHTELTDWIKQHPEEAKQRVTAELSRQMKREFPSSITKRAWPRLIFNNAVSGQEFAFSLKAAQASGFLQGEHDLTELVRSK